MKTLIIAALIFSANLSFAKQVPIDKENSTLGWVGQKKVPGEDHTGTVKIKKGTVNIDDKMNLIGGTLVIDMTTIENSDLSGKWKQKLETHLNSEDFFHTNKHPEANFKITKVETTRSNLSKVTGNLTLRGQTFPETFEVKVEKKGKTMIASGEIKFDRIKYGITYHSETNVLKTAVKLAKDKIIKDTIKLNLTLKTEKI